MDALIQLLKDKQHIIIDCEKKMLYAIFNKVTEIVTKQDDIHKEFH